MDYSTAYRQNLKYYCTLSLAKYERPQPFDNPKFETEKIIRLPLPLELRDDTAVSYNNVDLQLVGDMMNNTVGSTGTIAATALRAVGDAGAAGVGAAVGAISAAGGQGLGGQLAGKLAGAVGDQMPADAIATAVQQGLGVAPNPNPSVAFQGPVLREMSLTWSFMPTNEADSMKVREIVNYLKMRALPANSLTGSASVLSYPYLVQMNFYPWDNGGGGDWGWSGNSIIKMKRCFMASVNVNYNAGASAAFFAGKNNEPVIIQLSINFKEIEYLLSHDWDNAAPFAVRLNALGIPQFSVNDQGPSNPTAGAAGT